MTVTVLKQMNDMNGVVLGAGERVQLRSGNPGGITIHYDEEVPVGKVWTVTATLVAVETDA